MTLALLIEYDGTRYGGWQVQENSATVQGSIEKALYQISERKISIIGAGRTDAGVHAAGQVAHARLGFEFPVAKEKIAKALNANLPKDIRIIKANMLNRDFHSRFDAIAREYSYTFVTRDSVFLSHFAAVIKYKIDKQKLSEASEIFLGEHDFTTFSKFNADTPKYVCRVNKCKWTAHDQISFRLEIKADRFVYGMVRSLVGAMVDAARGKRAVSELRNALEAADRSLNSPLAAPQGLVLEKIYYPPEFEIF